MKATGIVRRIDDLGRVVIPKEIRRVLRIREGDPLEIYTARDGEVIFKKYSPLGELESSATQICDTLSKTSGFSVVITDRDAVIAVTASHKRELTDRRLSEALEKLMEQRQVYLHSGSAKPVSVVEGSESAVVGVAAPILSAGDVSGCVILLLDNNKTPMTDTESKLAQTVAGFLGKQME